MCAIEGIIDFSTQTAVPEELCQNMLATMTRRGPDQNGVYQNGPAALLHTRLTVVDPDGGKQPFSLSAGKETYVLVYNGELYNTEEIRQELMEKGHTFREHSDTEVLLHAYVEWKENCVQKCNGIFAFAVWEEKARRLFLARDRIGVKPCFFSRRGDALLFASEIKTLLAHPLVRPRIDRKSILELLLAGPGRTPGYGVFCDILELEAGCCARP